ncbi:MAG: bifunctional alpha,alpha-trehalose-phosphate synthase (UDP-forming)/trehalose-phosphatase [Actinomycetota bacterium]|nr:bifunctional alpha,alpha-trehalose-phosphate synthase (UDP-forming)/trehalose-phosphatase [Actinomycetota bacterium]
MTDVIDTSGEFIVVANRLPVEPVYENDDPDQAILSWHPAPGGLVSALDPVLRNRSSLWVGAGELSSDEYGGFGNTRLEPIPIPADQYQSYYAGFSNTAIWPLYHSAIVTPEYHRDQFDAYQQVNELFAEKVASLASADATVWVHDYQLQLLPSLLNASRPDLKIGFFLHIPFPASSLFSQLPWRAEILRGLLGSDLVGFQTQQDAGHFIDSCQRILGLRTEDGKILVDGREVRVGAFPIGIDAIAYSEMAKDPDVQQRARDLRAELGSPTTLMLGVDRLDYTKGIDIRLRAFAELLESERLDPSSTVLVQVAVPTRGDVREYQTIRDEVELLVGRFNGSLAQIGANPINYLHRTLSREELVALYLCADIMLVTPLRDGMNLVAKEYIACRNDNSGSLVLSEFTGSAAQLTEAWIVNPYDTDNVEQAISDAVSASTEDRSLRMSAMRKVVFESDVNSWANSFLNLLESNAMASHEGAVHQPDIPLRALARTPHLLVCCDYDGTLAPLVDDPAKARPLSEAMSALRQLSLLPATTVAVVSGRSLRDLAALSRLPPEIHLVGSHGSEFDDDFRIDAQQARLLAQLTTAVTEISASVVGSHIETKPSSVVVHVRRCKIEDREPLLQLIEMGPGQFPGVHIRYGKDVVELSVTATQKSDAVAALRHRTGASAAIFIGDDVTDESVFQDLAGPDVGIKVGDGSTAALWRVPGPQDVARVLAELRSLREAWLLGGHAMAIEDYALLSNMANVALLSPRGSIDWFCTPEPDSPAIFSALLGDATSGFFSIAPAGEKRSLAQSYQRHSLTVRTRWAGLTVTDFMPVSANDPDKRTSIVRRISGNVPARIVFAPRPHFGTIATTIEIQINGLRVTAGSESLALYAPGIQWEILEQSGHHTAIATVDPSERDYTLEFRYGAYDFESALSVSRSTDESSSTEFWSAWLSSLELPGIRLEAEKRAALTLRALCHQPTGAILAAATTSLPESLGGLRNWDYRFCWIRDAALTARELASLGSPAEAEAFLAWLQIVDAASPNLESLRPVYRLNGEGLGAEAVIESLPGYSGSRPVRVGNAAQGQLQIDVFGAVCLLIEQLSKSRGVVTDQEWALTQSMVEAVGRRWREPDHGIWEIRDKPKHHTHSRMMCWLAVDAAISIAARRGEDQASWPHLRDEVFTEIETHNWDERLRSYVTAVDHLDADAAVLQGILEGYPAPHDRIVGTVAYIEQELRQGGGVFRYNYDDGLPHGEGAMHICAAWLAGTYVRMGSTDDALQLLDAMLASAGVTGLLPEQVDPETNRGLGNHPQAYSHLGVLTVCRLLDHSESL